MSAPPASSTPSSVETSVLSASLGVMEVDSLVRRCTRSLRQRPFTERWPVWWNELKRSRVSLTCLRDAPPSVFWKLAAPSG